MSRGGGGTNRLRIIGGQWRGRKLTFPAVEGVRPSPDRVRETLFNWLAPVIEGARCLDLFAGSGALGLEALSRGAAEVVFVDRDRQVTTAIRDHLTLLKSAGGEVVTADVESWLRQPPTPFDIVFLDPPFRRMLVEPVLTALAGGWLAPHARIYVEAEAELSPLPLAEEYELLRNGKAGQVGYHLLAAKR